MHRWVLQTTHSDLVKASPKYISRTFNSDPAPLISGVNLTRVNVNRVNPALFGFG
jgi:hypothetical protein